MSEGLSDVHFLVHPVPYAAELNARHKAIQARLRSIVAPPEPQKALPAPIARQIELEPRWRPRTIGIAWGSPRSILVILKAVSEHYEIDVIDILSHRREARVVKPRQIAMLIAKQMTPHSYPKIGRAFGGKDHTTIIHAVRKYERLVKVDPQIAAEVEAIKSKLSALDVVPALRLAERASGHGG